MQKAALFPKDKNHPWQKREKRVCEEYMECMQVAQTYVCELILRNIRIKAAV